MLGCWRLACGRERRAIGRHAPQMLSRGGILPVCAGLYCIAGVRTSRLEVRRRRRRSPLLESHVIENLPGARFNFAGREMARHVRDAGITLPLRRASIPASLPRARLHLITPLSFFGGTKLLPHLLTVPH